ncbi:MAG TPA: hypothetical protein VNW92_12620, partial [Polyangiaceae bacterium]|nr:hypothetical protein [Polyangiaceae bacterium]
GCQKKDSSAPCGTTVIGAAGTDASGAGASNAAGATSTGNAGSAGEAAGSGGSSGAGAGGVANLGQGGSGAAAATGGVAGLGGSGGAPPDSTACNQLALADCSTNMDCQGLSGQRISGDPQCLSQYEVVACGTKVGCTPDPTRATDLMGHDWVFPSTCIPAGWTNSSSSGTRFDACVASSPDGGM